MLNFLLKILSLFKINTQKTITQNILENKSQDKAIQLFINISALNLMLQNLNTKQKLYKTLYAKASQELASNKTLRGNNSKQKNELHQIVNTYYDNLLILEKEIKITEETLKNYSLLFNENYLKLNQKYDAKYS